MSHDIRSLANQFIALDIMNGKRTAHSRIHKLCFIAHGWALALLDKAITYDNAFLYKFGPVYEKIYKSCVYYAGSGNVSTICENDVFYESSRRGEMFIDNFSTKEKDLINAVYNVFKDYDTCKLSSYVHNENRLWYNEALKLKENERIQLIDSVIKKEFVKMKNEGNLKKESIVKGDEHMPIETLLF